MRLLVDLDPIAMIRGLGGMVEPDPARAALLAEMGGAEGVSITLRGADDRDAELLLRTAPNLELRIAAEVEQGADWAVERGAAHVTVSGDALGGGASAALDRVRHAGVTLGIRVRPEPDAIRAAADLAADAVVIDTREYVASSGEARLEQLGRLRRAAALAASLDLEAHAAGGLDGHNLGPVAVIAEIEQLVLGRAVAARAVLVGLERAVRDLRRLARHARQGADLTF